MTKQELEKEQRHYYELGQTKGKRDVKFHINSFFIGFVIGIILMLIAYNYQ